MSKEDYKSLEYGQITKVLGDHLWICGESAIPHHADPWPQALVLEVDGSYPDHEAKAKITTTTKATNSKPTTAVLATSSQWSSKLTSGGRHSSAWRRSTEKPPCVLVSEAVNVLQKECTRGLASAAGGAAGISSLEPFSSGCYIRASCTNGAGLDASDQDSDGAECES
jgi:hypothetical protein